MITKGLGFGVPTAALLLEPETLRRLGKAIADQAQRATDVAPSLPSAARALVDQQAEDEGLWFQSATVAEAYLQQELRALHAAVERECPAGVAPTVPNDGLPPFYIRRLCSQCGASDEKIARDGCPEKCGRTATETPEQHKVDPMKVTDEMVNRFLWWKLPRDFAPDCGISFDGRKPDQWNPSREWPVGTNLFTAVQARAMLEHVLGGDETQAERKT